MYTPEHFALEDRDAIHGLMRAHPFAALITHGADGFGVTHIPTVLKPDAGPHGQIECHLARANSHWKALANGAPALMVYSGPQAYVTPSWYPTKAETGKVVPTWNYAVVHCHGTATSIDDRDWLARHVSEISDQEEADRAQPWATSDAPERYIDTMLRGIVGVRFQIARIEAKAKMSQNQPDQNRAGVVSGMRQRNRAGDAAVAQWVGNRNG